MNDLDQRLRGAFHARADAVRAEQLTPAVVPVPRTRRGAFAAVGLLAAAVLAAAALLTVGPGGDGSRATDPGPASLPSTPSFGPVVEQRLDPLPDGATASYDDGATGTLTDGVFTLSRGGATWSIDVAEPELSALTDVSVDLGARRGYVLWEGPASDPNPIVVVTGPDRRLVPVDGRLEVADAELPRVADAPDYVGWTRWIGSDDRLYVTAYRGPRVDEAVFRWRIPERAPGGVPDDRLVLELVPVREPLQQRP